jgi:hypothetical protein
VKSESRSDRVAKGDFMDRDRLLAASHSTAFGTTCGVTMAFAAAASFAAARFGMLGGVAPDELVLLRFLVASVFFFPLLIRWGLFSLAGIGWAFRLPGSAGPAG